MLNLLNTYKDVLTFSELLLNLNVPMAKNNYLPEFNLPGSCKALCRRMHTQCFEVSLSIGDRIELIILPLASSDTFFYLSKCATLPGFCATWGSFEIFVGYLVKRI